MKHFVLDEFNNKIPAYSAEEVLSILEQAIADGSLENVIAGQAVIDKIKCYVTGQTNKVAFVTEAQYNAMVANGTVENEVYYYITDDTSIETIDEALKALDIAVTELEEKVKQVAINTDEIEKLKINKYQNANVGADAYVYNGSYLGVPVTYPEGKGRGNVIGYSGRFVVNIDSGNVNVSFSVLSGIGLTAFAMENNKLYCLDIYTLGIDAENKFWCNSIEFYNITDNKKETVNKVQVETLNLLYK